VSSSPGPIHVSVFGKTDLGRTRDHNEDTFLVADLSASAANLKPEVREHDLGSRGTLCVVADGMGGAAAGELASAMASEVISTHMSTMWPKDDEVSAQRFAYRMREALELANQRIHTHAREHPDVRGMGTTATVVGILGQHLYLAQVGDSRAYLIILQALGPEPRVTVDLTFQELRRNDTLVLCSDGLSGQVAPEELADVIQATPDPAQACAKLIDLANARGGPDNITVVIARVGGQGLREPDDESAAGRRVFELEGEDEIETDEHPAIIDDSVAVPARSNSAIRFMWVGLVLALIAIVLMLVR
jgi:protein phosphatase